MVVHKKITISGKVVNTPSYIVHVSEESQIKIKKKVKQPKSAEPKEALKEEVKEESKPVEVKEETK